MATLTSGVLAIAPLAIDGYESAAEVGTLVHPRLGTADVDVILRPAGPRSGTMTLLMGTDEQAAADAETALRGAHVWTLTDSRDTVDMVLVVAPGQVRRMLDPETRSVWTVAFDWREVTQ